jgi:hypothetical protein
VRPGRTVNHGLHGGPPSTEVPFDGVGVGSGATPIHPALVEKDRTDPIITIVGPGFAWNWAGDLRPQIRPVGDYRIGRTRRFSTTAHQNRRIHTDLM